METTRRSRAVLAAAAVAGGLVIALLAPAAPAFAGPAVIPDSAMLQPEDLGGAPTEPDYPDFRPELKPPMPCGPDAHEGSDRRLRAEREIRALTPLHGGESPDVVLESVGLYKGSGAKKYIRELRAGLRHCDTDTTSWSVISRPGYGDQSMVVELSETWEYPDGEPYQHVTYIGVARVGHMVVAVADLGWEFSGGDADVAELLLERAVARAESV